MTFVFAAEDCKQLAKLPKVKCLRNSERQGRLYSGVGQACEWRVECGRCMHSGV